MSRVSRLLVVPIVIGLIYLTACIPVPIPIPMSKDSPDGAAVSTSTPIDIGVTTKEEILERIRKPDDVFEDKRIFAYFWYHTSMFAFGSTYGGDHYSTHDRALLIQFDTSGRVSRAEWVVPDKPINPSPVVDHDWGFIKTWENGEVLGYSVLYRK